MNQIASLLPELSLQEQVDQLADKLDGAKNLEKAARENRLAIEDQIIELLGSKVEGSFTVKGDRFSITTTGKLTRTIIPGHLQEISKELPPRIFARLFPQKFSLDLKELRYIENNEPELFKTAIKAVTTKPAKIAVSFKAL